MTCCAAWRMITPGRLADGVLMRSNGVRLADFVGGHTTGLRRVDPQWFTVSPTCTILRKMLPKPLPSWLRAVCSQTVLKFPTPDAAFL